MEKEGLTIFPYSISMVEISEENSTLGESVMPEIVADSFFSMNVIVALACGAIIALVVLIVVIAVVKDERETGNVALLPITDFFDRLKEFSRGEEMDSNEFSRDSCELNSSLSDLV